MFLCSCAGYLPAKVILVETTSAGTKNKYKIRINNCETDFYTDSLYKVGDIIK